MGELRALFGWYNAYLERDVTKLDVDELLVKLQKALPQYKVYSEKTLGMFGKFICVKQSAVCGLFIYLRIDGLGLTFDSPNQLIRLFKKYGLLWILLDELWVKKSKAAKQLMSDVQEALAKL